MHNNCWKLAALRWGAALRCKPAAAWVYFSELSCLTALQLTCMFGSTSALQALYVWMHCSRLACLTALVRCVYGCTSALHVLLQCRHCMSNCTKCLHCTALVHCMALQCRHCMCALVQCRYCMSHCAGALQALRVASADCSPPVCTNVNTCRWCTNNILTGRETWLQSDTIIFYILNCFFFLFRLNGQRANIEYGGQLSLFFNFFLFASLLNWPIYKK